MQDTGAADKYEGQIKAIVKFGNGAEDYDFTRFFQREMQEFHELVYWPLRETAPEIKGFREIGFFGATTTRTDSPSKGATIRFRLPNFVDGVSELNGKVYAQVFVESKFQRSGVTARLEPPAVLRGNFVTSVVIDVL